jgi:hypothetical protein
MTPNDMDAQRIRDIKMKAMDVIEKYDLSESEAISAMTHFLPEEIILEGLCEVIDKYDGTEGFSICLEEICPKTAEANKCVREQVDDEAFLLQMEEMESGADEAGLRSKAASDSCTLPSTETDGPALHQNVAVDCEMPSEGDLIEEEHRVLAKHWITAIVHNDVFTFLTCCTGALANKKFEKYRAMLSDEAFIQAMKEAEVGLRKQYGDVWEVYKSTWEPGTFAGSADLDAIKRLFCVMVSKLPGLDDDCDTDGYSSVADHYCLGAAMSALRGCVDAIPSLETPVVIPPGSTYSETVVLVLRHMNQWCSDEIADDSDNDAGCELFDDARQADEASS